MRLKADFRQFEKYAERLNMLNNKHLRRFLEDVSRELAARLLGKVIPRTPTVTGTLKRGWTAKTHKDAESGGGESDYVKYAKSLPVRKQGSTYVITITNPVEYAPYVEFGHLQQPGRYVHAIRRRLVKCWVDGQLMLTKSEMELEGELDKIIEEKLGRFFEQLLK